LFTVTSEDPPEKGEKADVFDSPLSVPILRCASDGGKENLIKKEWGLFRSVVQLLSLLRGGKGGIVFRNQKFVIESRPTITAKEREKRNYNE